MNLKINGTFSYRHDELPFSAHKKRCKIRFDTVEKTNGLHTIHDVHDECKLFEIKSCFGCDN